MASAIDLSRLPPPAVVEALDYETVLAAMKADLTARWPGFTALLESDPVMKLLEVVAYRETLIRARVNDAARAVLLATATGADLDQVGARFGVVRLVVQVADATATPPRLEVLEADEAFRQRIAMALDGWPTTGSVKAYRFHALSASAAVKDVGVFAPVPGTVRVAVLSTSGTGAPSDAMLEAVRAALTAEDVRPLTDTVEVVPASIVEYAVAGTLHVDAGPDAEVVRAEALAAVQAYASARHALGASVAVSGLLAALHRPGCRTVTLAVPAADLQVPPGAAPYCTGVTLAVTVGG